MKKPGKAKQAHLPLAIGLTGGMGAGKTTVARVFETLNVPVYYADEEARRLMNSDPELQKAITALFGKNAYREGRLNRTHIAGMAFNDPDLLEKLNGLVHPRTILHAEEWRKRQRTHYIIKEAALLFESGADKHLNAVIGVTAPLEMRVERVMNRDGLSREEVMKRIARQMDETEKMARCHYLISNDGDNLVIPAVLRIHRAISREKA